MNEALIEASCGDGYTDALTIGPFPGTMDSADVTIEANDVLMQFALGKQGAVHWQEGREYPMRPGSRTISEICGIRFRNKTAGIPATVTCLYSGPSQPRLGPVIPLVDEGVGAALIAQNIVIGAASKFWGPFDTSGWKSLLLSLNPAGAADGAQLSALYGDPAGPIPSEWDLQVRGKAGSLVGENLTTLVTIALTGGNAGAQFDVFAAPCNLDHQPPIDASAGIGGLLLNETGANGVLNGTASFDLPGYRGVGQSMMEVLAGDGTITFTLWQLDYKNIFVSRLMKQSTAGLAILEHPLVPAPMRLQVSQVGGTVRPSFNYSCYVKEAY